MRATVLVARRRGMTYREITKAHDVSHGSVNVILTWAKSNPDDAESEIETVFGTAADDPNFTPCELHAFWMQSIRRTLTVAMEYLDQISQDKAVASQEVVTRQQWDANGAAMGKSQTIRTRKGAGDVLYKVAGLLKTLAEQAPKISAAISGAPTVAGPSVQVNVSQQVGDTHHHITIEEVHEAEEKLIAMSPDRRTELLRLLDRLPELDDE